MRGRTRPVLAADLVAHLACPVSKQRLIYFADDACLISVAEANAIGSKPG